MEVQIKEGTGIQGIIIDLGLFECQALADFNEEVVKAIEASQEHKHRFNEEVVEKLLRPLNVLLNKLAVDTPSRQKVYEDLFEEPIVDEDNEGNVLM